jgi:hypothetical protein
LQRPTAVIDNASLVYLSNLHHRKPFFDYLRNIFYTLYLPTEVVSEYKQGAIKEPYREIILEKIRPETGFLRFCTTYDSIVLALVLDQRGIDKGEAESYAQFRKVNANFIISDDSNFVKAINELDPFIKIYSTLHIICWLHIAGYLPDWQIRIQDLHQIRPFKSTELRTAYLVIAEKLGLAMTKREISKKCSLSKIL